MLLRPILFTFAAASVVLGSPTFAWASTKHHGPAHTDVQVAASNFDVDDNILFLNTAIVLFRKLDSAELKISTGEYAKFRSTIGKSGPYADYDVNWDFEHGTFRYFNHSPHHNHFLEAIEWVLANKKPQEWQGPSFKAFQEALEHEETARWTTLITMRGHTPEEMLEGFRLLQKKGYIRHLPLVENIFPVTNPKFVHWASSPPERKPIALMQILDRIQAKAIDSNMVPILNQDGTGYERLHTLGFSDDDGGNIETMLAALGPEVVTNRWSCVKIVIFSKGKDKPRTVVMTRNGMTRPWTETEEQDFNRIVNNGRALSNPTQCRFLLEPSGDRNTNDKVTIGSHFTRLKKVGRITAKWPSL